MYLIGVLEERPILLLMDEGGSLWNGADLIHPDTVTVLASLRVESLDPPSMRLVTFDAW